MRPRLVFALALGLAVMNHAFSLRLDDAIPLWDKACHFAACAAVAALVPGSPRERIGAALGLSSAWEVIQFTFVQLAGGADPGWYLVDTLGDVAANAAGAVWTVHRARPSIAFAPR